ncbi:hypothetical protein BaRGS_00018109 [Batillaria attramentaria]|uniref:Uncharacterized protein n=1 Tax=Batillaria attramentaria TaxID=370345 RepID=A0ABD0KV94_9CAEN
MCSGQATASGREARRLPPKTLESDLCCHCHSDYDPADITELTSATKRYSTPTDMPFQIDGLRRMRLH